MNFDDFIKSEQAKLAIKNFAMRFEGFKQSGKTLDQDEIKQIATDWLGNFHYFEIDYQLLLLLLKSIEYVRDTDILEKFESTFFGSRIEKHPENDNFIYYFDESSKKYKKKDSKHFFICPLGEENESSFRLLSNIRLNSSYKNNYRDNINDILELIYPNHTKNDVLIFIDDFSFSGGQLAGIMNTFLGEGSYNQNSEHLNRTQIRTKELKDVFRKTKIAFYFQNIFYESFNRTESELKKLGLRFRTYSQNVTVGKNGFFGDEKDRDKIEEECDDKIINGILAGIKYKDLKPLLGLLRKIGIELLKVEHKGKKTWTEDLFDVRALGYENNANLIIGECNVPTITIPAIWLPRPANKENKIEVWENTISWKPLFYRTPKNILPKETKYKDVEDKEFPKIAMKKIEDDSLLWAGNDSHFYDLISFAGLKRSPHVIIYGFEESDVSTIGLSLNHFEEIFTSVLKYDKFSRRKWISYKFRKENDHINNLKSLIEEDYAPSIGIILNQFEELPQTDILSKIITDLYEVVSKKLTFLIFLPTRNKEEIKKYRRTFSLGKFKLDLFISASLKVSRDNIFKEINIFEDLIVNKSYIKRFYNKEFKDLLEKKEPQRDIMEMFKELEYFQKLKQELYEFIESDKFFIKGLINEFTDKIHDENWKGLLKEIVSIIIAQMPQHLEKLAFYGGECEIDVIRFEILRQLISNKKESFIDYWVDGTNADPEKFRNISLHFRVTLNDLIFPLLRFLNRNKSAENLEKVKKIIFDTLNGKYYDNQKLLQINLSDEIQNIHKFDLIDLNLSNRLLESGFDIFNGFILYTIQNFYDIDLYSKKNVYKFLLSTPMTTQKIIFLAEKNNFLSITK